SVRLGDQQSVGVHPELLRILRVQGVLGVDERRDTAVLLRVRHRVQGHGGLPGGLRAVDLDDPPAGQTTGTERHVQGDRPGGDHLHRWAGVVAETHHRTFAEGSVDLTECSIEYLAAVCCGSSHGVTFTSFSDGRAATCGLGWSLQGPALSGRQPDTEAMSDHRHPGAPSHDLWMSAPVLALCPQYPNARSSPGTLVPTRRERADHAGGPPVLPRLRSSAAG